MYPNLHFFFNDFFGLDLSFLKIFQSFGFFVAIAFGFAAWVLAKELKRKENNGDIAFQLKEEKIGFKPSFENLFPQGLLGFVFGFKIFWAMQNSDKFTSDIFSHLFSFEGNILGGLILGGLMVYEKYRILKKQELPEVKTRTIKVFPSQRIGDFIMVAAFVGLPGAKIFNAFETWSDFVQDPFGNLFSGSGLTFFGSLIFGGIGLYFFCRKINLKFIRFADSVAPAMILAYAIGRIGCQVAGDGDWGVYNAAYSYDEPTKTTALVTRDSLQNYIKMHPEESSFFSERRIGKGFEDFIYFPVPKLLSFLPVQFFAYTFNNNVNSEGIKMLNCEGRYCNRLPWPVFPTAFYETIMGLAIFIFLWSKRKKWKEGIMFSYYLTFIGLERFLIESIRVNTTISWLPFQPTQAELIAICLIFLGLGLYFYFSKNDDKSKLA